MALERQEEFFKEISETALKEMNIDDLTKQLTSDYNKDYYAGMATIRQSIKDTLQPIFKSLSNYNVYQMALYTCHTTKPTLIDKFFDTILLSFSFFSGKMPCLHTYIHQNVSLV